jgi:hypothetical protein
MLLSVMRTRKQIEASRRNGAQSRGPVTPEGKTHSASNATTHGLSSRVVVLTNENPVAWQDLLQSYITHWNPVSQVELDLVHDIVGARWRLNRVLALESAGLDLEMDKQRPEVERKYSRIDEPTRCALAFHALAESSPSLAILGRHETRLRRIIDRATAELRRLQNERINANTANSSNEPKNVEPSPAQQPAAQPANTSPALPTRPHTPRPGPVLVTSLPNSSEPKPPLATGDFEEFPS